MKRKEKATPWKSRKQCQAAFRRRLKKAREARGWSQWKLSRETGLSQPNIVMYESAGEGARVPNIHSLVRLADSLEVSTDWLLGRQDKQGNVIIIQEGVSVLS